MRSSIRLFRIAGINIQLHIITVFFFLLISILGLNQILFFLVIFSLVLMHELVHSLVALRNGVKVPKITLLPIGGLASIELPEDPELELKVSIAGPLSNFFLAALLFGLMQVLGFEYVSYGLISEGLIDGTMTLFDLEVFASMLFSFNLILGAFNLIPAFPMDGGRVFRGLLALWMDYMSATKIALAVGRTLLLFFIVVGFFMNFWWVLVGVFLLFVGGGEVRMLSMKDSLRGLSFGEIAECNTGVAYEGLTLREFYRNVYTPNIRYYFITDSEGAFKGVLDVKRLNGLGMDPSKKVGGLANKEYKSVKYSDKAVGGLKEVLNSGFALVTKNNRVYGYVTVETLESNPGKVLSS